MLTRCPTSVEQFVEFSLQRKNVNIYPFFFFLVFAHAATSLLMPTSVGDERQNSLSHLEKPNKQIKKNHICTSVFGAPPRL